MLTTLFNFWIHLNILKNILYLKHIKFWFSLFHYIFITMKACHKSKTKILLLGVSKILLPVYALIKIMFESSLLTSHYRNMCMVKQQAAGHSLVHSSWQCDCVYSLQVIAMGRMKREPYQLVSIHWLKMTIGLVKFIFCRHRSDGHWRYSV